MTSILQVEIEPIPQLLDVEVYDAGKSLQVEIEQQPQYLDVSITDASEHLNIAISSKYLGVFPKKVQWVDTDTEVQYNVVSNQEWQVQ